MIKAHIIFYIACKKQFKTLYLRQDIKRFLEEIRDKIGAHIFSQFEKNEVNFGNSARGK
jgi:hypothetical protein